jgi:hypothetical protein
MGQHDLLSPISARSEPRFTDRSSTTYTDPCTAADFGRFTET